MESGEIVSTERQVTYELQPKFKRNEKTVLPINYVADFVVTYKNGNQQVIDTKGMPDSVALLKRKMFWFKYPEIDYIWISYVKKFGGWIEYDDAKKMRNQEKRDKKGG